MARKRRRLLKGDAVDTQDAEEEDTGSYNSGVGGKRKRGRGGGRRAAGQSATRGDVPSSSVLASLYSTAHACAKALTAGTHGVRYSASVPHTGAPGAGLPSGAQTDESGDAGMPLLGWERADVGAPQPSVTQREASGSERLPMLRALCDAKAVQEMLFSPSELVAFVKEASRIVVASGTPPVSFPSVLVQKGRSKRRTTNLSMMEDIVHHYIDAQGALGATLGQRFRAGVYALDHINVSPSLVLSLFPHGFSFHEPSVSAQALAQLGVRRIAGKQAASSASGGTAKGSGVVPGPPPPTPATPASPAPPLPGQAPVFPYTATSSSVLADLETRRVDPHLMELLAGNTPLKYYSGTLVVEVRDFRDTPSGPIQSAETLEPRHVHRVVVAPSRVQMIRDLEALCVERWGTPWSDSDRITAERLLIKAEQVGICCDPSPRVSQVTNHFHRIKNRMCIRKDPSITRILKEANILERISATMSSSRTGKYVLLNFLNTQRRRGKSLASVQVDPLAPPPKPKGPETANTPTTTTTTTATVPPASLVTEAVLGAIAEPAGNVPLVTSARPPEQPRRLHRTIKFSSTKQGQPGVMYCALEIYQTADSDFQGVLQLGTVNGNQSGSTPAVITYPLGKITEMDRYVSMFKRLYHKEGNVCVVDTITPPPPIPASQAHPSRPSWQ